MNVEHLQVRVARRHAEADDIISLDLVHPEGADLPEFTAGSHVDVHAPGGIVRQYSLCNDPRERNRYRLGVLKEKAGRGGSKAMHENVAAGDELTISAPRNHFPLDESATHSILVAGGIGVTPMMAMAERLAALGASFEMHYCVRNRARAAFHDELAARPWAAGRLHIHLDDGAKSQLLDAGALLGAFRPGTHVYVCGPKGMMDWILGTVTAWPAANVHKEFFTAEPQAGASGDRAFKVKLKSTGAVYDVPADQTIITALSRHGIDIPISCEQGICGTCLTGVISGEPDHRDCFLTDDEKNANNQFTPCCSRSKSDVLVIDL